MIHDFQVSPSVIWLDRRRGKRASRGDKLLAVYRRGPMPATEAPTSLVGRIGTLTSVKRWTIVWAPEFQIADLTSYAASLPVVGEYWRSSSTDAGAAWTEETQIAGGGEVPA